MLSTRFIKSGKTDALQVEGIAAGLWLGFAGLCAMLNQAGGKRHD